MRTAGKCPHCGQAITEEDLRAAGRKGGGGAHSGRSTTETVALAIGWFFLVLAAIAVVPIVLAIAVGVAAWLLHIAVFAVVLVILAVILVKVVKWAGRNV